MKIQALLTLTLIATSLACSCLPIPQIGEAIKAAKDGPEPYYEAKVVREDIPSSINGDIVYKLLVSTGCGTTRTQELVTCGNSACCGVKLTVGQTWALPLKKSGETTRLTSCQAFENFNTLSASLKKIVQSCKETVSSQCDPNCTCSKFPCNCPPPCKVGFACIDGSCLSKCSIITCASGEECINGQCKPVKMK